MYFPMHTCCTYLQCRQALPGPRLHAGRRRGGGLSRPAIIIIGMQGPDFHHAAGRARGQQASACALSWHRCVSVQQAGVSSN